MDPYTQILQVSYEVTNVRVKVHEQAQREPVH